MTVTIDITKSVPITQTSRVLQLEGIFDVPISERSTVHWEGNIEFPEEWQLGLIVGPSGAGKTSIADDVFGITPELEWTDQAVIDDFAPGVAIQRISQICNAVGFNTIPAWMRPYRVLSNGERFRVDLARRLVESVPGIPIVVDEFTSVVDRQVAQIGSLAVQKWIRENAGHQFIGVSCHYDIVDWLQPDWILHMPTLELERRQLRRRPDINISISRVPYSAWSLFAPFHYLTNELNKSAKCFVLFVHDKVGTPHPAAFCACLHRPHAKTDDIEGMSRIVTLPDWQGLGLAHIISDTIASAYSGLGKRFHTYPAHPSFIRGHDRSEHWSLVKKPGRYSRRSGDTTSLTGKFGGRPCAVFRYVGPEMDREIAYAFTKGDNSITFPEELIEKQIDQVVLQKR